MQVTALYRYPVKSLTPEPCDSLEISPDGRVLGDRVLAFRFDDAGPASDVTWRQKSYFASLTHSPDLARIRCGYEPGTRRLWLRFPENDDVVEGSVDEPGDRMRIEQAMNEWYVQLAYNPAAMGRRRLPLRLVGDGSTGGFSHSSHDFTSMHSRESLAEFAKAAGMEKVSELRFRTNVVIEGCNPWEEFDWAGRQIRIGHTSFQVQKPVVRCLTTHADPQNGERNLDVLGTLTRIIGQREPVFSVSMTPADGGGHVHVGDAVTVD